MDVWEQEETPSTPGLFPVPIYRNENKDSSEGVVCSCGYECSSGACCCYLGASELACGSPGGAACGVDNRAMRADKTGHQEPSELLTLAIAASTVPDIDVSDILRAFLSKSKPRADELKVLEISITALLDNVGTPSFEVLSHQLNLSSALQKVSRIEY